MDKCREMLQHFEWFEIKDTWAGSKREEEEKEHLFSSPIEAAADKGHFAVSFLPDSRLH